MFVSHEQRDLHILYVSGDQKAGGVFFGRTDVYLQPMPLPAVPARSDLEALDIRIESKKLGVQAESGAVLSSLFSTTALEMKQPQHRVCDQLKGLFDTIKRFYHSSGVAPIRHCERWRGNFKLGFGNRRYPWRQSSGKRYDTPRSNIVEPVDAPILQDSALCFMACA
jgi:hypothetical protein